uniref:Uncharacterized protein n=1 Tax=viral metagenome TaxID=1070528 RepID=A0A6C0JRY3_9ZZZZ
MAGRPIKYHTEEERLKAKRAKDRKWYHNNKDKRKRQTYAEMTSKMNLEQYINFRKRRLEQQKAYLERKKQKQKVL